MYHDWPGDRGDRGVEQRCQRRSARAKADASEQDQGEDAGAVHGAGSATGHGHCQQLQALGNGTTLFVSIAAGTTIAAFEAALGARTPIVRTMPNTPAMVNRGITALCCNTHVSDADMALAVALMAAVGDTVILQGGTARQTPCAPRHPSAR